ncbi:MAG: 16S rRNA (guanine(527)-N(7))-methyltransferase RsmG [Phaeovulum sp.]|uniref:16S rRNA (guanine(527)-N(7))-methyltransferase RsmG n=1 Tax=Phaeovulum sp. TaxID=2934796 RepID=UPI0027321397|nr:16S rRNA (guanine(527)-N(7))-methyltransferase RsmG [Phaeovulum sp.]MDP2062123.1 16S rRNA (guanine(527)-N(7))-methyltransferase RsmG [Phaeovulum sp.]
MTETGEQGKFARETGVSRETMARLEIFEALLQKWNPAINLVAKSTLDAVWARHFRDSAQVFHLAAPQTGIWADLGSGGGFPGLVIAILAAEKAPRLAVVLLESDARKAAFLATVARETGVSPRILTDRIESAAPLRARFLSARALAPLPKLLEYAERHLLPNGTAFFNKGDSWRDEISAAERIWRFEATAHPSMTGANSAILEVKGVARA